MSNNPASVVGATVGNKPSKARSVGCFNAVERAGMRDLNEGQKISYEIVADKRSGKSSADNLKAV